METKPTRKPHKKWHVIYRGRHITADVYEQDGPLCELPHDSAGYVDTVTGITWLCPVLNGPDTLALQAELARLREAARWRKWPEEMPGKAGRYEIQYIDHNGKKYITHEYYEPVLETWLGLDFGHTVTHFRPIVGPGEESK